MLRTFVGRLLCIRWFGLVLCTMIEEMVALLLQRRDGLVLSPCSGALDGVMDATEVLTPLLFQLRWPRLMAKQPRIN